jgi:hypothetical protein
LSATNPDIRRLDQTLAARIPDVHDDPSFDSMQRFAYLEKGYRPTDYREAVETSAQFLKRVGQMMTTINAMARERSIVNPRILQGLEERVEHEIEQVQAQESSIESPLREEEEEEEEFPQEQEPQPPPQTQPIARSIPLARGQVRIPLRSRRQPALVTAIA